MMSITTLEKRITYRSDVNNQNYYSVSLHAGYYITPAAKVYVEGTWNRITNKKGDTSLYSRNLNISDHTKMVQALKAIT